jgi:hypothetical protein
MRDLRRKPLLLNALQNRPELNFLDPALQVCIFHSLHWSHCMKKGSPAGGPFLFVADRADRSHDPPIPGIRNG